ncbi:hypothetical protein PIB30_045788, partial [Stylosanthes scabra]|nr:hypothetical protein [Stylosanthes scabra]
EGSLHVAMDGGDHEEVLDGHVVTPDANVAQEPRGILLSKTYLFSLRTNEEVDLSERSSSSNTTNTQLTDPARGLIRGMMIDLNVTPEGSMNASNSTQNMGLGGSIEEEVESHQREAAVEHPMAEPFFVDHVLSDEEVDSDVLSEAEVKEMNYFTGSSIALTQPAISERYDCPTHFSSLNLDAMNEQVSHGQRGPDEDPTTEFEVGQEFQNKEAVLTQLRHTVSIGRLIIKY